MLKNGFWLLFGSLTLITLVFPEIIIFGFMLYFILGVILAALPAIFIYLILIKILSKLMQICNIRFPKASSAVIVLGLGVLIPLFFNLATFSKVKELHERDMAIKNPIQINNAIAIFADEYRSRFQDPNQPLCNSLCQRLLYNKAAKNVLVGVDYSDAVKKDPDRLMVSYSIEQGTKCEQVGYVTANGYKEDFSLKNVTLRMASGECLKKDFIRLSQADFIFIKNKVKIRGSDDDGDLNPRFSLGADTVMADGIEVLKKSNDAYEPVFRYTKIQSKPLVVPLAIGPTSISLSPRMKTGLIRYRKNINVTVDYFDLLQDYKLQMEEVFGDALAEPVLELSPSYVFEKKLQDSTASVDDVTKLFGIFINQYSVLPAKKSLLPGDADLFIKSLNDPRIGYFGYSWGIVNAASEEEKKSIIHAAVNRLLTEPLSKQETIGSLWQMLCHADYRITTTEEQRVRLSNDVPRINLIRDLINKRISEGWSRNGNYEACLDSLPQ